MVAGPGAWPREGLEPAALDGELQRLAAALDLPASPTPLASSHPRAIERHVASLFAHVVCGASDAARAVETELTALVTALVRADAGACTLHSAGSESILIALMSARLAAPGRRRVLAAESVHPATWKAVRILGLEPVRLANGANGRADPAAFAAALDNRTLAVVASAPAWASGLTDPIAEIAALAADAGAACHVDACIGGFLLPFLDAVEGTAVAQGWRAPGVTTISADLHKFAYGPLGQSALLFVDGAQAAAARFADAGWDGFAYGSDGVIGDRPFTPVVGAWAAIRGLGEAGYLAYAAQLSTRRERLALAARGAGLQVVHSAAAALALTPPAGGLEALSVALTGAGIANKVCRAGFVRVRMDPLLGDADFETLCAALAGVGRA